MTQSQSSDKPVRVYEPGAMRQRFWNELWTYRELFLVLAWRDLSVRYKQTVIGIIWALLKPLFTIVVFTVIFGRLAGLPSEVGVPYALVVFAGVLSWSLFSSAISEAGNSLVGNSHLISKVYFPMVIVPASTIVVALVDYVISLLILPGLLVWLRFTPGWQILLLPIFSVMTAFAALGPGLLLATLTVRYRDFRHLVPVGLQFGILVSPVGFSSSIVPEPWRLIYNLNPLVGVIDGTRWCIAGGRISFPWESVAMAFVVIALLLWIGFSQFRKHANSLIDVL
jgi:lipopolysaccharide transport system permease protein